MRLPILLSVPHAGLRIPVEVEDICILSEHDVVKDGDEGAAEIYLPLKSSVAAMVTTDIARAIVDMNRAEGDIRKDGIIKTHTCWDVPIYKKPPSKSIVQSLIERYHRPYHRELARLSAEVKLGIDCHTMAAEGPPVGPDPGVERPPICLSNGEGTCPMEWLESLASCLEKVHDCVVNFLRVLSQAEHDAGFNRCVWVERSDIFQEMNRAVIDGLRPDGAVQARHAFNVVVHNIRTTVNDSFQSCFVSLEVRYQHFNPHAG